MPNQTCPICKGTGIVSENALEYPFVTRDQIHQRCLYCNGSGNIAPNKKLPNGVQVFQLAPGRQKRKMNGLNVSKKASVLTIDNGVGYSALQTDKVTETPMFMEMALHPRLNKVLDSGKEFLIVTETEPYYLDVYRMIRKQEKKQGSWTQQDEERYVEALEEGYDSLMLDSSLRLNEGWFKPRRRASESINTNKEAING